MAHDGGSKYPPEDRPYALITHVKARKIFLRDTLKRFIWPAG